MFINKPDLYQVMNRVRLPGVSRYLDKEPIYRVFCMLVPALDCIEYDAAASSLLSMSVANALEICFPIAILEPLIIRKFVNVVTWCTAERAWFFSLVVW